MSTGVSFKTGDKVHICYEGKDEDAIVIGECIENNLQVLIKQHGHSGWYDYNKEAVLALGENPDNRCWNVKNSPEHIWKLKTNKRKVI